jgi:zinc protease
MRTRKSLHLLCIVALLAAVSCVPRGRSVDPLAGLIPDEIDLHAQLPVDPAVKTGALDNGLSWYVQVNKAPSDRAIFRLVVRAGSVLEDDDQRGVAHFIEHMAFNGTEHFAGNELVKYLESIGSDFGAHINAHTSWDETVYKLEVPADDLAVLDQALVVLSDWAHGIAFDAEEFERERGVVMEEWRLDQGLQDRMQDAIFPGLWHGSTYLERRPIGTEESLQGLTVEAARRYYEDWYRPDLMGVIAVGDFDPNLMQALIGEHFGDLRGPEQPRERVWPELPEHPEPILTVFTDPELPVTAVEVSDKHDDVEQNTFGSYRDALVEWCVAEMLIQRLQLASLQADAAWLEAWPGDDRLTPSRGVRSLMAVVPEGTAVVGIEGLLTEVERIARFGFTEPELGRARAAVMSRMEEYFGERETTDSVEHAEEIVRVFTTGESMPGEEVEYLLAQRWMEGITLEEADAAGQAWMDGGGRMVSVYQPEKEGLVAPTTEELTAAIARVAAAEIEPPADEGDDVPLLAELPEPGQVIDEQEHAALDTVTWTLANGATVVVKPTLYKSDDVRFSATSPGGSSMIDDADFVAGMTAISIAGWSGSGELSLPALVRKMAGHRLGIDYWLEREFDRLEGTSSTEDLELLMQRLHLVFAAPRFEPGALERERELRRAAIENRAVDPEAAFLDLVDERFWQGHFRNLTWAPEDLEKMDLAVSERIYRERFGDVGDFTFVFVGNLDPVAFRPLVERYIGSLPGAGAAEQARPRAAARLPGVHRETVHLGTAPRATVVLRFHGAMESSWLSRNRLQSMVDILEVRLRELLREEMGGTYGVGASADSYELEGVYEVQVAFRCDPERVDEMKAAMWSVIEAMRTTEVPASYVDDVKTGDLRRREDALTDNGWWTEAIAGALGRGEDPGELLTFEERTTSLTTAEVQATAKRYLDPEQFLEIVLLPTEAAEEEGTGAEPQPAASP